MCTCLDCGSCAWTLQLTNPLPSETMWSQLRFSPGGGKINTAEWTPGEQNHSKPSCHRLPLSWPPIFTIQSEVVRMPVISPMRRLRQKGGVNSNSDQTMRPCLKKVILQWLIVKTLYLVLPWHLVNTGFLSCQNDSWYVLKDRALFDLIWNCCFPIWTDHTEVHRELVKPTLRLHTKCSKSDRLSASTAHIYRLYIPFSKIHHVFYYEQLQAN